MKNGGLGAIALTTLYSFMPWLPGNPMTQVVGQVASSTFNGLVAQIQANYGRQTPQADANNQISGTDGGNTPHTGASPATTFATALCMEFTGGVGCAPTLAPIPGTSGGNTPSNATLSSSTNEGGSGTGGSGQAPAVNVSNGSTLSGDPSQVVQSRISALQNAIPANSQGRITMAAAVVQDGEGNQFVLVGTSEENGYLRPGVRNALQATDVVVSGTGHAEADIVSYASQHGLTVLDIGATRPVCASCQAAISPTGANISTPLKSFPRSK